ncbi:hypothetical protein FQN60_007012, partial [Etheostoma spectabile]
MPPPPPAPTPSPIPEPNPPPPPLPRLEACNAVAAVALQLAHLGPEHALFMHVLKEVFKLPCGHELAEPPQSDPLFLLFL